MATRLEFGPPRWPVVLASRVAAVVWLVLVVGVVVPSFYEVIWGRLAVRFALVTLLGVVAGTFLWIGDRLPQGSGVHLRALRNAAWVTIIGAAAMDLAVLLILWAPHGSSTVAFLGLIWAQGVGFFATIGGGALVVYRVRCLLLPG